MREDVLNELLAQLLLLLKCALVAVITSHLGHGLLFVQQFLAFFCVKKEITTLALLGGDILVSSHYLLNFLCRSARRSTFLRVDFFPLNLKL